MTTESLWTELAQPLRRFILHRVRSDADADDILQDVFVKIHLGIGTLEDDSRLHAWIFRIARNAIADHFRRPRSGPVPADVAERIDLPAAGREVAACLGPLMNRLPDSAREALELADLQSLDDAEVGRRLGLTLTAAKSRIQRARRSLRAALADCCRIELDRRGQPVDCACSSGECA